MVTTLLVVTGAAFAVTTIVGTVAAVVTKIKNKKNAVEETAPVEDNPAKKKTKHLTVKKVKEELEKRIGAVNKDSETIDEVIANKVESLALEPNTKEHKVLVAKAMKLRWDRSSSAYIKKVQGVMNNLTDKDNLEEVLRSNRFISVEAFLNKCSKSVVPSVSEKYRFYANGKNKFSLDSLDLKKKENRTAKIIASKDMVDSLFAETENMIINDTKVEDFEVQATTNFRTIKNEIENINEFMKIKRALQKSLASVSKLDKEKASKEEVDEKINELVKTVGEYKNKVDLIDLKSINDSLEKLQKDFGKLDSSLDDKLKKFKTHIIKMTNMKIREAVKNKVDRSELNVELAEIKGLVDGFKDTLNSVDLAGLAVKIEDLTKAYQEVYGHIDDTVKNEIEALKVSLNKGISVRIGNQLKKKLVGFDDKQIQQIVAKSVEEAKKIVPNAVEEKLSEEAFADRVIEALNTKIVVGKK